MHQQYTIWKCWKILGQTLCINIFVWIFWSKYLNQINIKTCFTWKSLKIMSSKSLSASKPKYVPGEKIFQQPHIVYYYSYHLAMVKLQCFVVIGRDGGLIYACQHRVLETFHGTSLFPWCDSLTTKFLFR